jgi:dynein heavy chain
LKTVAAIFMEGKALVDTQDERAPISSNLPPISGALNWTQGIIDRVKEPMEKLSLLSQSIQDREEFKDVQKLYTSLCKNIKEYNASKVAQWEKGVEDNTEVHLNKYLLVREETTIAPEGFVRVNFDPTLERLLREVKYLMLLNIEVPERASLLYKKAEVYRIQTGRLEIIVTMYNEILSTLLPVEKPLLQKRIESMDFSLEDGITKFTWNSQSIDGFIEKAMTVVSEQDNLVRRMKDNVGKMQAMMSLWKKPLFERRPAKTMAPDELEQTHQSQVMPRHEDIKANAKDIHRLVKETTEAIRPDKRSPQWLDYNDYLNSLIIEGVTTGINSSMLYLADQINIKYNAQLGNAPMFDIKVDLEEGDVCFTPSIKSNPKQTGIRDIIQKIIDDFIMISVLVPRLDLQSERGGDFLVEIKDQFILFGAFQNIASNFNEIIDATDGYICNYSDKEFLWKEKLSESFRNFLETGDDPREMKHVKENADGEEEEDPTFKWMADRILDGVQTKKPDLEAFDQKITQLTRISNEIDQMPAEKNIGWLKINASPLIKKLQAIIKEWIDTHTNFLLDNTIREISNIDKFINTVKEGIRVIPDESKISQQAEKDLLMQVMGHLRDVKMIQERTLNEIEPMKKTVLLLKKHQVKNVTLAGGPDYLVGLENSKTALIEVSERALSTVKEAILGMQKQEAQALKQTQKDFDKRVFEYRSEFLKSLPYNIKEGGSPVISTSYGTIMEYYTRTIEYEVEAAKLNDFETLFDIEPIKYKALSDCRNELKNLKMMWDLIALIDYQFENWSTTLWNDIQPDDLERLIKDFSTKLCAPNAPQNKDIKGWRAFQALNERVRNMAQVMPLIKDLHSPYMKDRHWKRLMTITGKTIPYDQANFCLDDLIKLELFKYSEEVTELVDSAQGEDKIEKKINTIQEIWDKL